MGVIEGADCFLQSVAPTTVQVDHRANAGRIHLRQVATDSFGRKGRFATAKMVVHVDGRESRLGNRCRPGDQHRSRLPVAEFQFPDVVPTLSQHDLWSSQQDREKDEFRSPHAIPHVHESFGS